MFPSVDLKLVNMRKAQNFVVTRNQYGHYLIQSTKSIGEFDGKGRGILNLKGSYFHHLNPSFGAKAFTFPAEVVQECQEIFIRPGEVLGNIGKSPVIFGGHTSFGGESTTLLRNYLLLQNRFITHDPVQLEQGQKLWNETLNRYIEFTGKKIEGDLRLRSAPDHDKFVEELLAKELVPNDV